jgi:hypothetical protein
MSAASGPKLVVLAAGIGSRFGGPKQMEPVGPSGEYLLEYAAYDAARAGFDGMVIVLRRELEEEFRQVVGRSLEERLPTSYAFQEMEDLPGGLEPPAGRTKPWGTAHAVLAARRELDGPFAIINADDFYGAEAYAAAAQYLMRTSGEAGRYCMVGYRLEETLSDHGAVTRGVCVTRPDGMLEAIVERPGIRRIDKGLRDAGGERLLPGAVVSMNLWGFTPDFLGHLETAFQSFLEEHGNSAESECFLPVVVGELLRGGQAKVEVLQTPARWFGITHREDAPAARGVLRGMVDRGIYPESLRG